MEESNLEIISVEEEKKLLFEDLKGYYTVTKETDEFLGINRTEINIPIANFNLNFDSEKSTGIFTTTKYRNIFRIILLVANENGAITYRLRFCHTNNPSIDDYSNNYDDDENFKKVFFLTERQERFNLEPPFDVEEEFLPAILSISTRIRLEYISEHNNCNNYDGILDKLLFPSPFNVVRFIVNNGKLPDEQIDELYDKVHNYIIEKRKKMLLQ